MAREKGRAAQETEPADRKKRLGLHSAGVFMRSLRLSPTAKALRRVDDAHLIYGLFKGAIIGSELAYPGASDGGLVYERAESGQWLSYDFQRQRQPASNQLPDIFAPLTQGKLFAAMLNEVVDHDPAMGTPDGLLDLSSVDHTSRFVVANKETLVAEGMLASMTYREAYTQVGAYEEHAEDLDRRSLSDELVHAVTPKGHTLVFILGGKTLPGIVEPLTTDEIERHLDDGMRLA